MYTFDDTAARYGNECGGDGTFCVRLRQLVTEEYLFWESIREIGISHRCQLP